MHREALPHIRPSEPSALNILILKSAISEGRISTRPSPPTPVCLSLVKIDVVVAYAVHFGELQRFHSIEEVEFSCRFFPAPKASAKCKPYCIRPALRQEKIHREVKPFPRDLQAPAPIFSRKISQSSLAGCYGLKDVRFKASTVLHRIHVSGTHLHQRLKFCPVFYLRM